MVAASKIPGIARIGRPHSADENSRNRITSLMVKLDRPLISRRTRSFDGQGIRLTTSLTVYGGALGVASVLISFMVRTDMLREPEHLSLVPSVFFSLGGAAAALLITWPVAYWLRHMAREPLSLPLWWGIGFGYGLLLPFLTGAILPLSTVFMDLYLGIIDVDELVTATLDAGFRAPLHTFTWGALALFNGMLTGALFGTGAWVIHRLNASQSPVKSRYGPWVISLSLGSMAVAFAVLAPAETLARLG